jgi:antitoxin component YwqK of YwqJK toxin-antitoxin module
MKRMCFILAAAILAASCVSDPAVSDTATPATPQPAPVAAVKVRKERIEEYKTPIAVKETVTFSDGVVDRITVFEYSDDKLRLLSSVSRKPSAVDPIERVVYEFKDKLLVSRSTFGADGALAGKSEFSHGTSGEVVKETILDGKGTIQSVSEYTWDNSRKTSWLVKSSAGLVLAKTDYFYEGDLLASARLLDGAGNAKGKVEYSYVTGNVLGAVKYFDANGAQDGRIEYTLKDGRVTKETVFRTDGRIERQLAYEYSPEGALIKKTLADASGKAREVTVYENAFRTDKRTVVYFE